MKILVVQETDWIGRNPIFHHRFFESLSIAGHEVTAIDFDILWPQKGFLPLLDRTRSVPNVVKFFPESRVTVLRPAMLRIRGLSRLSWLLNNYVEISRFLERENPDILVGYGLSNSYVALTLARKHHLRFVFNIGDALHAIAEPEILQPIAKPVEQYVIRHCDRMIVLNKQLRNYAIEMGSTPEKLEVVPQGTAARRYDSQLGEATRRRLGLNADDVVMLFLGWLYTFSGLRELTAAMLENADPKLKLLVVGDGDLLPELQALKERLGDRLVLTGRVPLEEVPAHIAAADVCLLPSYKNKTMEHIVPAKVIEYLEAGKFVVATRLKGLEAEFGSMQGIRYIDSPPEVLSVVRELRTHGDPRAEAARRGNESYEFMARRESWDEVTARFERILVEEATKGGRRAEALFTAMLERGGTS